MAAVDLKNARDAIKSLFESDSTLYGLDGLIKLNRIFVSEVLYDKAKIDVNKPYKLFLKADSYEYIDTRMQNRDYAIIVEYRVEGLEKDPQVAKDKIDDIIERIDYLVNNEMWTGDALTDYYTNADTVVIDMVTDTPGTAEIVKEGPNNVFRIHGEGTIRIEFNFVKVN